jgi:hypothetical protein
MGVISTSVGDTAAVIAPATAGPLNLAGAFARGAAVATNFSSGPLVELASYIIGKPAVCVRSDVTTAGDYWPIDVSGMAPGSTCVPSADATTEPIDEYELHLEIARGGTVGTPGILYKLSFDNGRSQSAATALGTATAVDRPAYGCKINLAPGTLTTGDVIRLRTKAPREAVADLQAAEAALRTTSLKWDFVVLATPVDAALFAELDSWLHQLHQTDEKFRAALVSFRGPNPGETEAQYLTAAAAFRAANHSPYIAVGYHYCQTQSKVSPGHQLRRPTIWPVARRAAAIRRPSRTDLGQVAGMDGGPLPADVKLYDASGNPMVDSAGGSMCHDEALSPGGSDMRFVTLRTRQGYSGVFVEKPWVFSQDGSDIFLWQHRSLVNKVKAAVQTALTARLRSPVLVNPATGFILESEALDIENSVDAAVRAVVGPGPDVSAHKFTLHRDDPLLQSDSPVLNGDERIVPLAYPQGFAISIGFVNPAVGKVA